MPSYNIDVPGEGTFKVDSPTELSDEQAYAAVLEQMKSLPKADQSWDVTRGFKAYMPQTQETFGGAQAVLGLGAERLLGKDSSIAKYLTEHGLENIKAGQEKQRPLAKETDTFTNAWEKGIGSVLTDWLPYQIGQGAANILETGAVALGGAAVGSAVPVAGTAGGALSGILGKSLVKRGVKEAAEKILKEKGEDAAEAYIAKEAKKQLGLNLGLITQAGYHGFGEVGSRAIEEAQAQGKDIHELNMSEIFPAAAVHAAADFVSEKIGLGALDGLSKPTKNMLMNVGKSVLFTGAKEVPPELLQSAAERYGSSLPLADRNAIDEYINTAAASFGMSVVPGTVGGLRSQRAQAPAPELKVPEGFVPPPAGMPPEATGTAPAAPEAPQYAPTPIEELMARRQERMAQAEQERVDAAMAERAARKAETTPPEEVAQRLQAASLQGTGQVPVSSLEQAAAEGQRRQAAAQAATQVQAAPEEIHAAVDNALRSVEENNGVATVAQAQLLDQFFPDQKMYDRVEGAPAAEAPAIETVRAPRETVRYGQPDESQEAWDKLAADREQAAAAMPTEAPVEQPAPPAPEAIADALNTPAFQRTSDQKLTLSAASKVYSPEQMEALRTPPFMRSAEQKITVQGLSTKAQGNIDAAVDQANAGNPDAKYSLNQMGAAYTPEAQAYADQVKSQLAPAMRRFGLSNVALKLVDSINNGAADGAYFRNIIQIALDSENPMATLRHEVIHALKKTGAFTADEWNVLSKKAREQWINQHFSPEMQQAYFQQYMADNNGNEAGFQEYMEEEAIAEAFKHFAETKPPAGRIGAIFRKLKEFFAKLAGTFKQGGFDTTDKIFAGVERGEFAPMYGGADVAPAYQAKFAKRDLATREGIIADGIGRVANSLVKNNADYNGNVLSQRAWNAIDKVVEGITDRLKAAGDKDAMMTYLNEIRPAAVKIMRQRQEGEKYSLKEEAKEYPANAAKTNNWKATPFAKKMAEKYEEKTGENPYLSEGRVDVPTDMPKYAIKKTGKYAGEAFGTDAQGNHPILGIPVNKNGTVTLYVPTTNALARQILRDKKLVGATPEATRIYLTNESAGQNVMAKPGNIDTPMEGANVMVHVDPAMLQLDQEFEDGRKDFFIPLAEGQSFFNKMKMTKLFTLDAPRARALSQDTKFTDLERRVQEATDLYASASSKDKKALKKEAKLVLKQMHNITTLLSENGKLEKTRVGDYGLTYEGKSVASMGLGLASAQKINEKNLSTCPKSAICEGLCLGETSGQNELYGGKGQFRQGPRLSQYLKTEAFVQNPEAFAIILHSEIQSLQNWADKNDYKGAVRLNVTSDFPPNVFKGIINSFPDIMFYDYTKLPTNSIAPNHHLTYSSTGVSQTVNGKSVYNQHSNWDNMVKRMNNGFNVAMAFTDRNSMPKFVVDEKTGQRFQVWDGDNYDARFLDPKREDGVGMIVGLTNKDRTTKPEEAAAKYNGFFVDYDPKRDGDTVVIQDQSKFGEGKKVIPIAKFSLRAPQTPEFKEWFEGSQVTTEDGKPMQVYHGTDQEDSDVSEVGGIAVFNEDKPIWFAKDPALAEAYAKETAIYPAFLSIKNPLIIEQDLDKTIGQSGFTRVMSKLGLRMEDFGLTDLNWSDPVYRIVNDGLFASKLRELGYDGIFAKERGYDTYAALYNQQIKSAFNQRPSKYESDIRYSLRKAEELAPAVQRNTNFKRWFGNSKIVDDSGKPKIMYHGTARDITEFKPKQAGAIFVTDDPKFAEDFSELSSDYMVAEYYDSLSEAEKRKLVNEAVRSLVKDESITKQAGKDLIEKYKDDISGAYRPLRMIIEPMIRDNIASNANIMPVYVRAENPFDYDNPKHLQRVGIQMALDSQERGNDIDTMTSAKLFANKAGAGSWEVIETEAVQEAIRNAGFDSFYINEAGRKNLAVYSPNQIKSAVGNVGTYNETGDIRYSKRKLNNTKLTDEATGGKAVIQTVNNMYGAIKSSDWRTEQRVKYIDKSAGLTAKLNKLAKMDADGKLRVDYLNHAKDQNINLIRNGMQSGIPVLNTDGTVIIQQSENNLARGQIIADQLDTHPICVEQGMNGRLLVGEVARALRGKDIMQEDEAIREEGRRMVAAAAVDMERAAQMKEEATKLSKEGKTAKSFKLMAKAKKLEKEARLQASEGRAQQKINREKVVTPEQIAYAEHLYNTIPQVREVLNIWKEVNHGLVRLWKDVGLLNEKTAAEYLAKDHYVPLFKSAEDLDENAVFGFRGGVGAKSTPKMKRLEGGEHIVNIWENVNKQYAKMTALAFENQTRAAAAEQLASVGAAFEVNKTDPRANLRYRRDGKEITVYAEDELSVAAFQSMSYQMGPIMKAFGATTKALRWGALLNPMFWVKQLIRDPIHASMVTDVMVTPLHAAKEFVNLTLGRDREVVNILSAHGVIGEYGNTMNIHEYLDSVGKESNRKPSFIDKAINKAMHIHEASDAATRVAIYKAAYKKAIADGMSHERARDTAVFKARESINFAVQGNSPVMANLRQMIPFLSAQITSLDTVYRAMTGHGLNPEEAAAARRIFASRAMMMTACTIAYAMMYSGDKDYDEVPDYEKDGNWLIPVPSSTDPTKKSFITVPVPFELGFLFKTMPEAFIRYLNNDSTGKELLASYKTGLIHNLPASGNPIPQAFNPIIETITNHSFFTGRPIEGMGDQGKPVAMRGARASETAKMLSNIGLDGIGLSPAKIDHLMSGYFAQLGSFSFELGDAVINGVTGKEKPTRNLEDMPFIRSFMTDPTVNRSVATFYDLQSNATQAYTEFNDLKKTGNAQEIHDFLADPEKKKAMIARAPLAKISDEMTKLNNEIKRIQDATNITADQKRDLINKYKAIKANLARKGVEVAEKLGLNQ
jgi:hypothetical protein